ncbi:Ccs1/ResB-related putative cytochrome C-type biogenesis protein [Serinicoccus hydrothermalis]|uniref:Ccs1/ResB-related putative cytochrome C-type biogenesis protein n=1 Tax=Serinicoccus hydrothermalis TaxID=1758689 RepID=A0A1B1ND55_9MICO|nr:cytochrome c biogenesis protein ResB [Serinicoccus hydrothermalis]ANS79356.1 Ccs1/ResB-related putative cytochrome C-type biogenesis protein [Serinicoccus hydrothermalis]
MSTDQHHEVAAGGPSPERIAPDYPKNRTELGGPRLGLGGWARWAWRQLTSMRTAIYLLLLLAAASIPGSIFPQRSVDPVQVRGFFEENPGIAPWLDRFFLFDVFSSPWFASIYLLLMISLIGCIAPRTRQHLTSLRAQPPRTPRRLTRFPATAHGEVDAEPGVVLAAARQALKAKGYRLRTAEEGELAVSGEKGYLKETGNLLFHTALLGVIVAFAAGNLFGWRGEIIIKEGESWTAGPGTFDTLNFGPLTDASAIPTFTVELNQLEVDFETQAEGAQFGQPRRFEGLATVEIPGREAEQQQLAVNYPVSVGGDSIFLLGNGYAPVVTVRSPDGKLLFSDAVTFLPQDNNYASEGVIKVTGQDPGLGLVGGFLPTLQIDPELGMLSSFPGLVDPTLALTPFEGEMFPDGRPQSVFALDTDQMTQVTDADGDPVAMLLRPGEYYELPDGTRVEFENVIRWAGLLVRHDPGRMPALALAGVAVLGLGLMLGVKRRRIYVRVAPGFDETGAARHTDVRVAGLPKGSDPGLQTVVDDVLSRIVSTPTTTRQPWSETRTRND